jgi:MSHA biogenesis protein MshP
MRRQSGFSLVSAIFVIVILMLVLSFMVRVSTVQSSTVGLGTSGTQAFFAARGGLQWGVYQAVNASPAAACPADTTLTLDGYSVRVRCESETTHTDETGSRKVMRIIARAERGVRGQPDFVMRSVEATVAAPLP